MNEKHIKNIDLIDGLLQDNLSKEQKLDVQSKLDTNKEFQREYAFVLGLRTALSENRAEKILDKFSQWDSENSKETTKTVLVSWKKYLAIAASIALLIFASWNLITNKKVDTVALFESNFTTYPSEIIRGGEAQSGYVYYSNKDYNKAITLLKEDSNPSSIFFLGNSYLAINEPNKAILAFNKYTEEKYKLAAQWYLALAHIQNKDIEAAKITLKDLKQQKSSYAKKAALLLEAI